MSAVRIRTEPLGGGALSRLIQRGEADASWFAAPPKTVDEWTTHARQRVREREWTETWDRLAPAFNASGAAADRLSRVRRENGVVITTGQQPGLFGGPLYTWSKALGALAMANTIERVTGVPATPVFWAATDDADFVEASSTVLSGVGGAEVLRSENAPAPGTPMALSPLGDVMALVNRLRDASGSAADSRAIQAVIRAYGVPSRSVGDAFVLLLRELLEPLGIPVLDASHEAVREAGDTTLRSALVHAEAIERGLRERSTTLGNAGFDAQVENVEGLTLAFTRDGPIKRRVPVAEALKVAADRAALLTPNVLLRPIMEHAILPTIAYMGGPGELAYFAQTSAVADAMEVPRPVAVPRWSCTLVEPHIGRLLESFDVSVESLADPAALEGAVARGAMSEHTARALASLRAAIDSFPATIARESEPMGLAEAMRGGSRALTHRLDRIERRLLAGIKRRERALLRDVATLRAALYPRGNRQERAINVIPLLARHGLELLDEMRAAAVPHAQSLAGAVPTHTATET